MLKQQWGFFNCSEGKKKKKKIMQVVPSCAFLASSSCHLLPCSDTDGSANYTWAEVVNNHSAETVPKPSSMCCSLNTRNSFLNNWQRLQITEFKQTCSLLFFPHDSIFTKDRMPAPNDGFIPRGFTLWCDSGKWDLLHVIIRGKELDEQVEKTAKKWKYVTNGDVVL